MVAGEVEQRIVLDDWEAGELAVQYDDQEPEEVIRWALETMAPRSRRFSTRTAAG